MNNKTETRTDNTANYTCGTNVPLGDAMARAVLRAPIYKCDLLGDNHSVVISFYEKKELPNWFRRQCQRFFLGTKWTKL